jgi:hypothetical protein
MIKMLNASGRSAPVIICDICGKRIKEHELGAAVFPRTDSEGAIAEILHVHKGQCHDEAEQKVGGGKGAPWLELINHFSYLLHNLGLSVERLEELDQEWPILGNLP